MNWRAIKLRSRIRRQGSENVNYAPPIIAPLLLRITLPWQRPQPTKAELRAQSARALAQWRAL